MAMPIYNADNLKPRSNKVKAEKKPKIHKAPTFDLIQLYEHVSTRQDDYQLTYHDEEHTMQLFVDGYIRSRLYKFVVKTFENNKALPKPDGTNRAFVRAMVTKYPTLAGAAAIAALNITIRMMDFESRYSDTTLAEYIRDEFNRGRRLDGVYATIEYGDVILKMQRNFTRAEARELVEASRPE